MPHTLFRERFLRLLALLLSNFAATTSAITKSAIKPICPYQVVRIFASIVEFWDEFKDNFEGMQSPGNWMLMLWLVFPFLPQRLEPIWKDEISSMVGPGCESRALPYSDSCTLCCNIAV